MRLIINMENIEKAGIPWEAISAKLKNEADNAQLNQIQQWLESSQENTMVFSQIINIWSITQSKADFYQPDMDENWQKLMQRINYRSEKDQSLNYFRWIKIAAILVVGILIGMLSRNGFEKLSHQKVVYSSIVAPEGSKTWVVLPDSTQVWLNSGSELTYGSDYSAKNRQVKTKGECYFEVVKDPRHPFVVSGSQLKVKVFGTHFNMNEDVVNNRAEVTLVSGKVQVFNSQDQLVSELSPGEQLSLNDGKFTLARAENLECVAAWRNNMLIFDNQPFEKVIQHLEKWYGVKINLDKSSHYSHNYTFKVKTESLREVLNLISIITPITYHIEGEQITIKYNNKMK